MSKRIATSKPVDKIFVPSPQELDAITGQAWNSTVRINDLTDRSNGGSGVALRVANRFFIATAEHILLKGHRFELVPRGSEKAIHNFCAYHRDVANDVGILEISSKDAKSHYAQFINLDQVYLTAPHSKALPTLVVGFPGELISERAKIALSKTAVIKMMDQRSFTYGGFTQASKEWPETLIDTYQLCKSRDVLIEYAPPNTMISQGSSTSQGKSITFERPSPALEGMSGCGIWFARVKAKGVWRPDVSLIGIQVGLIRKTWIHGIRIEKVVRLIQKHYPDCNRIRARTIK